MSQNNDSSGEIFGLLFVGMLIFGAFQVYAGFVGIAHYWGGFWAFAIIALSFLFRTSLPIMIGAFLCARNVWDWNIIVSIIFVAPSLLFIVPSLIGGMLKK